MAKKRDWEADHQKNIDEFVKKIHALYKAASKEAVRIGMSVNFDPNKPFEFSKYPSLNSRVKQLFNTLASEVLKTINDGSQHEWLLSAAKNDELVNSILPTTKVDASLINGYMNRNLEALKEFQARKVDGMDLSDRVWRQTDQFKQELELGIDLGLLNGKSASEMTKDIQQYLQNPNMLFRRVRDARGVLHLSKAAKAYSPGQGVYRFSYKNALRLARTETNMAYRASDHARWTQLDFVVGFEVRRSNNPYGCPTCESLKGRYPKSFTFRGWHPQCRCNCVSILATKQEISDLTDKILDGEDASGFKSENEVTQMPAGWTAWIQDNNDRLLRLKSQPFFIRDNFKNGRITGGLKLKVAIDNQNPVLHADPKFTPSNIKDYEKKYGVKINRDIFKNLTSNVPMLDDKRYGSHYNLTANTVNIRQDGRLDKSKWFREAIVYHEYGHAADVLNKFRESIDVKDLMGKYRSTLQEDKQAGYIELDNEWRTEYFSTDKTDRDTLEQLGALADTLMSLNTKYGAGHTKKYFSSPGKKEAEFVAHAFENKFAGNKMFKKLAPDLYDDMIKLIDNFLAGKTK